MKAFMPWLCLLAAQQVCAVEDYSAYRLGDYSTAAQSLDTKNTKDGIVDYYLGRLSLYGYGQLKNDHLALRYFSQSAQKGFLPAILWMAKYSLFAEKSPENALPWFKKAAAAGDVDAQMMVAAAYLFGLGVKKNEDQATNYYIDAAKKGNAIAQFTLAENFMNTRHATNNKLGLIWLSKSAAQGNPKALTKLAGIYLTGKMLPKDPARANDLLQQAAKQQYAPAMLALGDLATANNQYEQALSWYHQATSTKDPEAYLHLALVYLQENTPISNPKEGFLWTLKAAQAGLVEAKKQMAVLYQKGLGVSANEVVAKEWLAQVDETEKKSKPQPLQEAALWLSNGATNQLDKTRYKLEGILSPWNNKATQRQNVYNQAPQFGTLTRQDIFKPKFELIQPNQIPLNVYYEALLSKTYDSLPDNEWTYPGYPLNEKIQALEHANSSVLSLKQRYLPTPYIAANYEPVELPWKPLDHFIPDWRTQVNYHSVFSQLYFRAILGESQSQFEIGQLFEYGIGVAKNKEAAVIFYQTSAEQQHLKADYQLGVYYLKNAKDAKDYQQALTWLTDAAFKGNPKAQYVLARVLQKGIVAEDGTVYVKAQHEEAMSMLYLAAANHYGPAEYELAEYITRDFSHGLNVQVKKQQIALVRRLYQGAASHGVAQALLPLAFYDAMDQDKSRQDKAFLVATEAANRGDPRAALLLGMLYDRGIGTTADHALAIHWYQLAADNPISQFILGTYLSEGDGIAKDKERAIGILEQSGRAAFSYADFNLAVMKREQNQAFLPDLSEAYRLGNNHAGIVLADYYLAENDSPEKMSEARAIYSGLAEKGDQHAQMKLGYMLENGLGLERSAAEAERFYLSAANQGNATAEYLLARLYQLGALGQVNEVAAKMWYEKAALQMPLAFVALGFLSETSDDNYSLAFKNYEAALGKENALSAYNLGLMYEYGKGIPVDFNKAAVLFQQAADKGVSEAMNQLAGLTLYGLGVNKDVALAESWYKKAANAGNTNAMYALGLLAESNINNKPDLATALTYYTQAADKGNEKAMLALARIYDNGLGVPKDIKRSTSIYEELAQRQNAYAQYQLGRYYLEGITGEVSTDKGRQLLEKARENGSQQASKLLEKLEIEAKK
jgi:enhanced entry protein EnhC